MKVFGRRHSELGRGPGYRQCDPKECCKDFVYLLILCNVYLFTLCDVYLFTLCEVYLFTLCDVYLFTLCDVYLFTLCNVTKAGILITIFT